MALSEEEDISSLKLRAKAAFSLVELQTKETRGKCDEREIPMLCRTLGLNPTQEQLLAIVEARDATLQLDRHRPGSCGLFAAAWLHPGWVPAALPPNTFARLARR